MLDIKKFLSNTLKDEDRFSYKRVRTFLMDHRLARQIQSTTVYEIYPLGREVVNSGGYKKYLDRLAQSKAETDNQKLVELENTEFELKLNKFYFKWRWLPFALSAAALIISILVAFLK